ncbi:MAG TPA: hypothetical protein VGP99_09120, partial [Tepidisphaeraceae bacterium]|nr:hypothetical protein [Tepidisphaeraceae bacterium]
MTRYLGIRALLMVFGLTTNIGCVSFVDNVDPKNSGHWRLLDAKRILDQKFDREKLEELAGKPTIDAGDEWLYVGKFEDWNGIPLDMLMAIYSSGPRPVWKTTVVTFDEAGFVSGIRTSTARSEIYQRKGWWTLMGINFDKHVRVREVPATQASTSRPSNAVVPATTHAAP